jgi:hypothetical protein
MHLGRSVWIHAEQHLVRFEWQADVSHQQLVGRDLNRQELLALECRKEPAKEGCLQEQHARLIDRCRNLGGDLQAVELQVVAPGLQPHGMAR